MNEREGMVIVGTEKLKDIVRQVVREELVESRREPEFLDKEQVAKLLGCKPSSISTYISRDGLPVAGRCGRIPRFRHSDVVAWAEARGNPVGKRRPKGSSKNLRRIK